MPAALTRGCTSCGAPLDHQTAGCRSCYWRHRERTRPKKRYPRHAAHKRTECAGCGIPLSDGYALGCETCSDRRHRRLNRGELETPTGYPGEAIANTDPRGRIKAAAA